MTLNQRQETRRLAGRSTWGCFDLLTWFKVEQASRLPSDTATPAGLALVSTARLNLATRDLGNALTDSAAGLIAARDWVDAWYAANPAAEGRLGELEAADAARAARRAAKRAERLASRSAH